MIKHMIIVVAVLLALVQESESAVLRMVRGLLERFSRVRMASAPMRLYVCLRATSFWRSFGGVALGERRGRLERVSRA